MDTSIAKGMIDVIRLEQQRRSARLAEENPNVAYDQWLFTDGPFVNELCLVLLVAIRHQVEGELVRLSARVSSGGTETTLRQYQENVRDQRTKLKKRGEPAKMIANLKLSSCTEWNSMEALRHVANCYKHSPLLTPDDELLRHLKLDSSLTYMPLPESSGFREGLASYLDLPKDANYCDIADEFLSRAECFLTDVRKQNGLSRQRWFRVSHEDFGY